MSRFAVHSQQPMSSPSRVSSAARATDDSPYPSPSRREETTTIIKPQRRFRVTLFNDEEHTFDEVILQLQKAVGCSLEVAEHIANTAHREGSAIAFVGDQLKCDLVAGILRQINLDVDVSVDN